MAECIAPYNKKDGSTVPCGKCPACTARNVSQWSFRLMQQLRVAETAHFITLTYDTAYIPITASGKLSLAPRDLQLFFKRLRKSHNGLPIKYFAVGEYGGRTRRPHYHVILFNARIELIQDAWGMGQVNYGDERGVTEASVGYCLKYIHKICKIGKSKTDDRVPSFPRMSKGLGLNYLTPAIFKWHHGDKYNRMYCTLLDGRKISMPRYYKLKLYSDLLRKDIADVTYIQKLEREGKTVFTADFHQRYNSRKAAVQQSFLNAAQADKKTKV